MISLDELIRTEGVALAGQFTPDGRCSSYKANMDVPEELAQKAAEYVSTVSRLFSILGEAFSRESGMNWAPEQCWTYTGGDWTVVVVGNTAVFVDPTKTSIDQLVRRMMGGVTEQVRQAM